MPGVAGAVAKLVGGKAFAFVPLPFAGQIALALAASFVLGALAPKPSRPRPSVAAVVRGRQDTVRQSVSAHRTVFGEVLVGGYINYLESYGSSLNETLSLVATFAAHQVKGFREWRYGDDVLTLSGNDVQGTYLNLASIYEHLGDSAQVVDPTLDAASTIWGANHRGRGRANAHHQLTYNEDRFGDFRLESIKALVQGDDQVFDTRSSTNLFTRNPALLLRHLLTTKKGYVAAKIDDATFTAAANVCDEQVALDTAAETFTADAASDVVTLAAKIKNLAIGDGVQVSSDGTLPAGLAAVTTYFWVPLTATTGKLATTYLNALAGTVIDITGAGSGTHTLTRMFEPRYTANGTFLDSDDLDDVVLALLAAMAGTLVHTGGKWRVYAGEAGSASITLDLDAGALAGPVTADFKVPRRELFNAVKPIYVDPDLSWQAVTAPATLSATYEAQDGGARIFKTLELPYTTSPSMAQRLAKIELERHRGQARLHFRAQPTALRLQVNDMVKIDYDNLGYSAKNFRVTNLTIRPDLTVDLALREEEAAVWTWSAEEQAPAAAPSLNVTTPEPLAPTDLTLASGDAQLLEGTDGTVHSRIKATWTPAADQFVIRHEIEFKKSSDANWSPGPPARGATNEVFLAPVEDGVQYDVRVRGINGIGRESDWQTVTNHTVTGKAAAPAEPATFLVSRMADGTRRFTWAPPSPLPADVRTGGGYRIRYKVGSETDWSAMSDLHDGLLISSPYETNDLAAGTYSFAIKTIDSSDNESTLAKFIELTIGDPRLQNVLLGRFEHDLGFPGTKTDCFVDTDGVLRSTSSETWADLPATWSALPDTWNAIVAQNSPITYETPEIDLGVDVNFTPLVSVEGTGTQTIKMKTGTAADGGVVGSWVDLAAVTGKRYVQIQVAMADGTAPDIQLMTTLIDGEVVTEQREDVDVSTESASWFSRTAAGHFLVAVEEAAAITQAQLVLQNVGSGWTWELVSKSGTVGGNPAAEFKTYNGSGTLADATVDVTLRGPK